MAHAERLSEDEARRLPAHELRKLSVLAGVDPRTVQRVIFGLPTQGLQRSRVLTALREQGLEHLLPAGGGHG